MVRIFNKLNISEIILIDHSEYNLYNIDREISNFNNKIKIHSILSDINDMNLYSKIKNINLKKIDYIFHAAAYKHVPLLEKNVHQAVKNNIIGSYNIINLALKIKCSKILLISTDKAVRPTNVMGATKRFAELLFQSASNHYPNISTTIVRFGNVVGSMGSVIPLFQEQINKRIPITVTDPNVTRYLMTIHNACNLVIQSNILSDTEGNSNIYFLDMGKTN